jgi:UDP-2,3-diacylglucosamine pyrophosphatase LpxH
MLDLFVLSDLHLGLGKNPETGRYARLEAFFYDDDFADFCADLVRRAGETARRFKLVLNGDTFDLLRLESEATGGSRYCPAWTPAEAAVMVRRILEGHPRFVQGLGSMLSAGHEIVFIAGNHDAELQWEPVQEEVRRALLAEVAKGAWAASARDVVAWASSNLTFEGWFHHEPGRIWIEHGCQYDPENAFRYQLRRRHVDLPDELHRAEIDLPLGTFFQRYLYNSFGNITFIVPNARSNTRYFRWLVLNRPRMLARTFFVHLPFFLQVLRRLAKSAPDESALRELHDAELSDLSARSGLGSRLAAIDQLKKSSGQASIVARQIIGRIVKATAYVLLGGFMAAALWMIGFNAIGSMSAGIGFKAVLFLTLNFLFLIATIVALTYLLLRPASTEVDPHPRAAAGRIATIAGVPIVTFGHTHDEVIARLDTGAGDPAWYFNTGTWIAVFTADSLLPRERVQYTFLRVIGRRAELLHWSPARAAASPVILLEEDPQPDASNRPPDVQPN